MKNKFYTLARTALVLVYIVVIAGALVRMTGSGMGCPDWPKCFGYYIPPTDIKELTWSSNRTFEEGQVIIKDEKLLVARTDFTTGKDFDASQWRPYTKHDYAIFNPKHTWIEYINRLAGALAGIVVFAMAVVSVLFWRDNKKLTYLSWLSVFLMGFQGWLGAKVVYSVLNPIKITLHMLVALLIIALLLYIIKTATQKVTDFKTDTLFQKILTITFVLTIIQIVLGTQVRQFVDDQTHIFGEDQMNMVLQNPDFKFYIHRSFSILVLGLNLFLVIRNKKMDLNFSKINWVFTFVILEVLTGIFMYYFDFPFASQPLHLVFAALLFGVQFYLIMENFASKKQAV